MATLVAENSLTLAAAAIVGEGRRRTLAASDDRVVVAGDILRPWKALRSAEGAVGLMMLGGSLGRTAGKHGRQSTINRGWPSAPPIASGLQKSTESGPSFFNRPGKRRTKLKLPQKSIKPNRQGFRHHKLKGPTPVTLRRDRKLARNGTRVIAATPFASVELAGNIQQPNNLLLGFTPLPGICITAQLRTTKVSMCL